MWLHFEGEEWMGQVSPVFYRKDGKSLLSFGRKQKKRVSEKSCQCGQECHIKSIIIIRSIAKKLNCCHLSHWSKPGVANMNQLQVIEKINN